MPELGAWGDVSGPGGGSWVLLLASVSLTVHEHGCRMTAASRPGENLGQLRGQPDPEVQSADASPTCGLQGTG